MSAIPAFEIGVWNLWILAVPFVLANILPLIFSREKFKKISPEAVPPTKLKKRVDDPITGLFMLALIYSIFLPLKLETVWFYTGLAAWLLGMAIFTIATLTFLATPLGEPVTKGLYRYSRNPLYIAMPLMFISMGIASASWIFLLLAVIFSLNLVFIRVPQEERFCLEKYGDSYRQYMNRTPRWIGIPKS